MDSDRPWCSCVGSSSLHHEIQFSNAFSTPTNYESVLSWTYAFVLFCGGEKAKRILSRSMNAIEE